MSKVYDVVYGEKYTDGNGQEKTAWRNCGVVIEGPKGMSIKLNMIPVNFSGWLQMFEPKDDKQQAPPLQGNASNYQGQQAGQQKTSTMPQKERQGYDDFDDSIPF